MLFTSVLCRRNDGDEMSSGSGFNRWTEFLLALSLSFSLLYVLATSNKTLISVFDCIQRSDRFESNRPTWTTDAKSIIVDQNRSTFGQREALIKYKQRLRTCNREKEKENEKGRKREREREKRGNKDTK